MFSRDHSTSGMDNPWANAWVEDNSAIVDGEVDITAPAWSSGQTTNLSLWGAAVDDKDWQSPYDSIRFGSVPDEPVKDEPETATPSPELPPSVSEKEEEEEEEESIAPDPWTPPASAEVKEPKSSPSRPSSPDAFGTFETGTNSGTAPEDPWTPSQKAFPATDDGNAWGAAWAPSEPEPEAGGPEDEWESAKRQQQIQDKYVPPELLASILKEFEDVSNHLWPESEQPNASEQTNWRSGIESVPGLESLAEIAIPRQLSLPPVPTFSKTFVSKRVADSVRLTRSLPIARMGPMSKYLATKGSTAWEASVKARQEVVPDSVLPAGWRIMEKQEEVPIPAEPKKKSGILSSLFSRRASTPPVSDSRPTSPTTSMTGATTSPRPSIDSVTAKGKSSSPASSTPITSPTTASAPSTLTSPNLPVVTAIAGPTVTPSTLTDSPNLFPEAPPPPSAVSRFLTRFSRTKSSPSHSSLALSSDDLDLLSDIIPSASDDAEDSETDPHLKGLVNMIASPPLPDKLPPPLAPPPKPTLPTVSTISHPTPNGIGIGIMSPTQAAPKPSSFSGLTPTPLIPNSAPLVPTPPSVPVLPKLTAASASASSSSSRPGSRPGSGSVTPIQSSTPTEKKINAFVFPPPNANKTSSSSATARRTPIAIMSSSSSSASGSGSGASSSFSFLPPPPAAPSRSLSSQLVSTATATSSSNSTKPGPGGVMADMLSFDDDDFSDFTTPPETPRSKTTSPINQSSSFSMSSKISSSSLSSSVNQDLISSSSNHPQSTSSSSSSNSVDLWKDDFDDFDDFISSSDTPTTLRTPSPPRPPAKSPSRVGVGVPKIQSYQVNTNGNASSSSSAIPPPHSSTPNHFTQPQPLPAHVIAVKQKAQEQEHQRQLAHSRKASREAEHQRTRSLMQNAATSRWPASGAPKSPLPPILSPPPVPVGNGNNNNSTTNVQRDEIDFFSVFEDQQARVPVPVPAPAPIGLGIHSSVSSPAELAPAFSLQPAPAPARKGTLPSIPLIASTSTAPPPAATSGPPAKTGGLSAQDLSFFEGL
ncbi:hypothetical protein D9758_006048 [Tetrapyrgos nigripes]|uniref:Uncharacterized protein n=1 Tax=Tetrapyrgos nigripes TaxID=182062 RepID=A0A8H5G084_9AGAR|nr:hypothetical protein D9758_006048 [Tetrapyrgos nigripes]